MCVVSMIGDHYDEKWRKIPTEWVDYIQTLPPNPQYIVQHAPITMEEYNKLKCEVEDMKALLRLAVEYDKRTGQPGCEVEDKIARLRHVAEAFKIDIDEILK